MANAESHIPLCVANASPEAPSQAPVNNWTDNWGKGAPTMSDIRGPDSKLV